MICEGSGRPIERGHRRVDAVPLFGQNADELVEAGQQVPDLWFTAVERRVEFGDDIADPSDSPPLITTDNAERLLGGG